MAVFRTIESSAAKRRTPLARKKQKTVVDLVPISTDDKSSVLLTVAGQTRNRLIFRRIREVSFASFLPSHKLLVDDLRLPLRRGCRRHALIRLGADLTSRLVQFASAQKSFFGENPLPLNVYRLIAELSGRRAQSATRVKMRMSRFNNDSFHSLRHNVTDLRAGAHCVYNINIHLLLVVAYRRKAISGAVICTIQEVLHRILDRLEVKILEFSGEADHVHLLISIPPSFAVSDLVNRIKTATSKTIRRKHAKEIAPFLWGNRFWSKSYCAISVGDGRSIETIKRYIQGQEMPS